MWRDTLAISTLSREITKGDEELALQAALCDARNLQTLSKGAANDCRDDGPHSRLNALGGGTNKAKRHRSCGFGTGEDLPGHGILRGTGRLPMNCHGCQPAKHSNKASKAQQHSPQTIAIHKVYKPS